MKGLQSAIYNNLAKSVKILNTNFIFFEYKCWLPISLNSEFLLIYHVCLQAGHAPGGGGAEHGGGHRLQGGLRRPAPVAEGAVFKQLIM